MELEEHNPTADWTQSELVHLIATSQVKRLHQMYTKTHAYPYPYTHIYYRPHTSKVQSKITTLTH